MIEILPDLKTKLFQSSFPLDRESLGSEPLAKQLQQFFADKVLELIPDQNSITESDDFLHFQASAVSLLGIYHQPVEVVFFLHNNQLECLIITTLPDIWDFSWGYPELPDYTNTLTGNNASFFYNLRFTKPLKILFSSYNYQEDSKTEKNNQMLRLLDSSLDVSKVYQGVNYFAAFDLNQLEFLKIITDFANIKDIALPFHGYIEQQENDLQIKLIVDLSLTKKYQDIFEIGIFQLLFYSSTSLFSINASSGIIFGGGLTIGQSQSSPKNVALIWPIGSSNLIIKNAEEIPFLGLEIFTNLLEDCLPNDNSFPIKISDLKQLVIREITLHLSLVPPTVSYISLAVGVAEEWRYSFLNETFVIEDLVLKWEIFFGSQKNIRFDVLALFEIGGGLVEVAAIFPDFIFYGELALYQTIDLSKIFKQILPNAEIPQVSILDLAVNADIKQENYALELDIASDWEIPLGSVSLLPLKNLQINLEIDNSGVFATIDCVLNIAEVDIILLAMHGNESGATGWTFEGSTRRGQELPIGKLMKDLATLFGITEEFPSALEEIIIENLKVYFNTVNKDFYFTCEAEFPLNDEQVDIIVNLNITRQQDGSYKKHFDGHITIGSLKFALIFDTDRTSTNFLAAYHDDQTIKIKDLIGYIDSQLKDDIPEGLEINLKDALFAYSKQPTLTNFLFGLNIDGGINLSNLPLVGREFPPNQTLKISLQVLVTKANFTATELQTFNTLYTEGGIQLPTTDINQRLDLIPSIQLGSELKQLELPITINKQSGQIEGTTPARNNNLPSSVVTPSSSPTQIGDSTTYFTLQKSFGPAHVERIGLKYQDSKIWVLLDASLSLAGLTLTLDGLSVSSPLTTFDPQFNLHGIGIDYQGSGTVTIGGAFLKQGDEYSGTAFIKTADLTLSAVGSYYTPPHGDPSLFIYALLNKPIGGPAFFFVTGLAAAFGYNRALTLPTIEQVAIFPLIQAAISSTGSPTDLSGMLRNLDTYIKPATGEVFIAVGVKFTSFKLIDSFALLIATFGDPFELHILGLSTLITPTPEAGKTVTPLAEVQMALKATFIPEQGFLAVNAQLTPSSYIFSKACHLVGGFAYYSWFSGEHAGDFVITLGGYHPDFNVPTHYPQVPRLGFNWQVDDHLTIKGDAYYALTPAALMAGGHLQARWESGPLSAWFNAGANFLIAWKPYHYEASISVDMGVSYTFEVYLWFTTIHKTISVDIGADLQIWGPDFSGIAHIHLWIISFDVSFGSSSSQQPQAIDWTTFKASFLPADDQICSIVVKDGLVKEIKSEHPTAEEVQHLGVINPKHFSLITNSIIPSNQAKHATEENYFIPFGIAPMDLRADSGFTSTHTITITRRENNTEKHVENEFKFTPILKNMPSGLWGNIFHPDLNAPQTINNLLSGFEITPGTPPEPGQTQEISSDLLQDAPSTLNDAYHLNKLSSFAAEPLENTLRVDKINQTLSDCPTRTTLLQALGFSADEIDLHSSIAYDFLVPPQIGTLTPLAA